MAKVKYISNAQTIVRGFKKKARSRKTSNLSPYEARNNNIGDMLFLPQSKAVKIGYKPYANIEQSQASARQSFVDSDFASGVLQTKSRKALEYSAERSVQTN